MSRLAQSNMSLLSLCQVEKLKLANTELTGEQVSYLCDELKGLKKLLRDNSRQV